jgi:hypothetical protein
VSLDRVRSRVHAINPPDVPLHTQNLLNLRFAGPRRVDIVISYP